MELLEEHFHVLQVQFLKVTQKQLNAVLHHVLLIQMLQKMLDVAIKLLVLKLMMYFGRFFFLCWNFKS